MYEGSVCNTGLMGSGPYDLPDAPLAASRVRQNCVALRASTMMGQARC